MPQQTAVEWLFLMLNNSNRDQEFAHKLFQKAKEIEMEQVINACIHTASALSNVGLSDTTINAEIELAKQYYNKKYGKE